jgi:hypothetical protein
LFLKLISKTLSRKEGKVNTYSMASREKHRHRGKTLTQRERIFSPGIPTVKVEELLHGLRGKKYHIFSPSWIFVLFLA